MVTDIDPEWLKGKGVRGVLLDVDNTLAPWNDLEVPPEIVCWVEALKKCGIGICLMSNNHEPRLQPFCSRLGAKGIHDAMKPFPKSYKRGRGLLGCTKKECLVIGDQLFTDVLGGKLSGMRTVLVEPISRDEHWWTKRMRRVERLLTGRRHEWREDE